MAHKNKLEVIEGLQAQGVNESINWSIDTTNWGGSPSGPGYDVFDEADLSTSLKATLMPGTATVSGDNIILPALSGLTADVIYRVTVSFTSNSNDLEGYFRVKGT